jgi:hypothetical protein
MLAASPQRTTQAASGQGAAPAALKVCPACGAQWRSCSELLQDPGVKLTGYQPALHADCSGLLLFLHQPCGTTMGLELMAFHALVPKPILTPPGSVETSATRYCLARQGDEDCPRKCVCEFVSATLDAVQKWPKEGPAGPETH